MITIQKKEKLYLQDKSYFIWKHFLSHLAFFSERVAIISSISISQRNLEHFFFITVLNPSLNLLDVSDLSFGINLPHVKQLAKRPPFLKCKKQNRFDHYSPNWWSLFQGVFNHYYRCFLIIILVFSMLFWTP